MMKKLISMMMMLALLTGTVAGFAQNEQAQEDAAVLLTGTILEVAEDHVLLDVAELGEVQAWVNEETVVEGVDELLPGQVAVVLYNGMMTRSLPPQVAAIKVSCFAFTGEIAEMNQNGFLLHPDEGMDAVQVNAPDELLQGLKPGSRVTVYFNGAMTMSLPGQIGAGLIVPAE